MIIYKFLWKRLFLLFSTEDISGVDFYYEDLFLRHDNYP